MPVKHQRLCFFSILERIIKTLPVHTESYVNLDARFYLFSLFG